MSGRKHMTHMTALDKNLLTALVEQKDILKMKTKDTCTNDSKKAAWAEIAAKFNSSYCVSAARTPDQLCKAWENMMAKARRESLGLMRKTTTRKYPTRGATSSNKTSSAFVPEAATLAATAAAKAPSYHHQAEEVVISLDPRGHMHMASESQEELRPLNGARKRLEARTPPTSRSAEIMIMRHEQHEAEMEKLHWETLYWRTKYEMEFGPNRGNAVPHAAGNNRKNESADQCSSDNCSNF